LTHRAYVSKPLNVSKIPAPGTPSNTYWWRVKACDSFSRCSNYSDAFKFTYDSSTSGPPQEEQTTTKKMEELSVNETIAGSTDPEKPEQSEQLELVEPTIENISTITEEETTSSVEGSTE